ncbi:MULTISPECIES: hypothetical protein [Burkholderia]|nr:MULTISPECIES: hypothetical protein [Burkholderia]
MPDKLRSGRRSPYTSGGRGIGADGRCAAADFFPFMRVDEVFFFLFA